MKNINLIPKVPLVHKHFGLFIASSAIISIAAASALLVYYMHIQSGFADKEAQEKRMTASVQVLSQQRKIDPLTNDFNKFSSDVARLESLRHPWIPVMDLITSQLPNTSRLTSFEVNEGQGNPEASPAQAQTSQSKGTVIVPMSSIKIDGEFAELTQVSEYIVRLQQSELTESVAIKNIQRLEQVGAVTNSSETDMAPKPTGGKTSVDVVRNLEQSLKPPASSGDELLNQLQWMVSQQMLSQQFGIKVPDKPPNSSADDVNPGSSSADKDPVISIEEINQARSQVEQFKKQLNPVDDKSKAQPKEIKLPPSVMKYVVSFELTLKPQTTKK